MFLGIEIGGTKLQLGVGTGDAAQLSALERVTVELDRGAGGILEDIERIGRALLSRHPCQAIGVGFGGPVDTARGVVLTSHQVSGWDHFPLRQWCLDTLGLPTSIENDASTAALAEATWGAGKGANPVLYLTVGTGIGGGLIVGGKVYRGHGCAAVEIGHLRLGGAAGDLQATVETVASGPAITRRACDLVFSSEDSSGEEADLRQRCGGKASRLTAVEVAAAAGAGNAVAQSVLDDALRGLGWAIAQCITLFSPEVVVVGGGVSLIGERAFFEPLREHIERLVFPPLAGSYRVHPAALGEEVVVHGALALAASHAG